MKNLLLISIFVLVTVVVSTQTNATQLPLYFEECNSCSEIAMQRKAEAMSRNATVVVINAEDGMIKVYDVREYVEENFAPVGIASPRKVPSEVLMVFNKIIANRDAHLNDLKTTFPNLEVPVIQLTSKYGEAAKSLFRGTSNEGVTAYDLIASSADRRQLYGLLNGSSHFNQYQISKRLILEKLKVAFYKNYKPRRLPSLDELPAGYKVKVISMGLDFDFFSEKIVFRFADGSVVYADVNEKHETYDLIFAKDPNQNHIPFPGDPTLVSYSDYKFEKEGEFNDFKAYVSSFWSVDLLGVGSYQSPSCRVSCKPNASNSSNYICTNSCPLDFISTK